MPKGSPERTNARREEIISACEELYKTKGFKDVTIRDIGNATSFTRTSIYNYFQTKEEIFLAILKREYDLWAEELNVYINKNETMTDEEIADCLAATLDKRQLILKLLSMNHYDMEENSRMEALTDFKVSYGKTLQVVMNLLGKFRPQMKVSERQGFVYAFFPFLFGVYPYTVVTDKQKEAMKEAGIDYTYQSVYELIYACVLRLL
ncbi:MAG: TetR/AcrR family transcriptional regulator [Lachnospiraceae bacterium]|nr:TetR/AcrR family transcriptional regulator [Lachnospiraceae bacterium]